MTRPLLFALLCFLTAQKTPCQKIEQYFDYRWQPAKAANARFYTLTEKTDSGWHSRTYYLHSLILKTEGLYADSTRKNPSGAFRSFHPSRIIATAGKYNNGKKQGPWISYYSDGSVEDSTVYDNDNPVGIRQSWYRNGYPMDSCHYNADGSGVQIGWFDNGAPSFAGRYAPGYKKTGKWKYFYREGGTSAQETYDIQGKLLDKRYFSEKGATLTDTTIADKGAEFPGGWNTWSKYLAGSLYLPDQYRTPGGDPAAVVIEVTVDETGRVVEAEVAIPFYPAFDKIALEAVRTSPVWLPAVEHNRQVRNTIRIPVVFTLPGK